MNIAPWELSAELPESTVALTLAGKGSGVTCSPDGASAADTDTAALSQGGDGPGVRCCPLVLGAEGTRWSSPSQLLQLRVHETPQSSVTLCCLPGLGASDAAELFLGQGGVSGSLGLHAV